MEYDHQWCRFHVGEPRAEGPLHAIDDDGLGGSHARPAGERHNRGERFQEVSVHGTGPAGRRGETDPTKLFRPLSAIVPGTGTLQPNYRNVGQTLEDENM